MGAARRHDVPLRERPAGRRARPAREVAGDRDIRVGGGAHTIVEPPNAGFVEEMQIALAPVVFGEGIALAARRFGS